MFRATLQLVPWICSTKLLGLDVGTQKEAQQDLSRRSLIREFIDLTSHAFKTGTAQLSALDEGEN